MIKSVQYRIVTGSSTGTYRGTNDRFAALGFTTVTNRVKAIGRTREADREKDAGEYSEDKTFGCIHGVLSFAEPMPKATAQTTGIPVV